MINPTYDIEQCHDEIDFEKDFHKAQNDFNNGYYFCAIDIANNLLSTNVEQPRKSRARNLIADCKEKAIITVNVSVSNTSLSDDLNSYIVNQLQDYKNNYSYKDYLEIKTNNSADFTINLAINSFDYNSGWDKTETKYACIEYTRNDERTRTVTYEEQKWVTVGDVSYYVVKSGGVEYYIKNVSGYMHYLGSDGQLYAFNLTYEKVMETKTRTEEYTVKQYQYKKVSYSAKYGDENMNFDAKIELKENSGGYLKYSQNKSLSHNNDYSKFNLSGSYNVDDIEECPNATLNTWTDKRYTCGSIDKSPFSSPADPFKGKNEFYEDYLKDDLRSFIRLHVPQIMEKIKEKHNDMQCN